jgi:copper homeostasis protein (lipoprotein)
MFSMNLRAPAIAFVLLLTLAACTREKGAGAPAPGAGAVVPATPADEDIERTWAGLMPCSDCQGIDTRLILRTQRGKRSYLLSETYLGGVGQTSFNRAGTWTELVRTAGKDAQVTYVLDPDKAAQSYALQPDGALEMLDASGKPPPDAVSYRLQRL